MRPTIAMSPILTSSFTQYFYCAVHFDRVDTYHVLKQLPWHFALPSYSSQMTPHFLRVSEHRLILYFYRDIRYVPGDRVNFNINKS